MSANNLLFWMSARGEGSWQQFRAAVEELHLGDTVTVDEADDERTQSDLPLYQALRLNLQRLGHAEFFNRASDAEWRVTPPSLAKTKTVKGWMGIYAGARSKHLLDKIREVVPAEHLSISAETACPDHILVQSMREEDFAEIAEQTGLHLQNNAPETLLACLPAINDPTSFQKVPIPLGKEWKVEYFAPEDLRWRAAKSSDAKSLHRGLLRFSLFHQQYYFYCFKGAAYQVPNQVGKYIILKYRKQSVLKYDSRTLCLVVPVICRPPFLIERALVLCSGTLPKFTIESSGGMLEYHQISEGIARMTANLLRQELK